MTDDLWLTHGRLIAPRGVMAGAVRVSHGRIVAIRSRAPRVARAIELKGAYLAPGFIDLHIWGPPETVSREAVKGGTTAFLTTLGPEPSNVLLEKLSAMNGSFNVKRLTLNGAACLGVHLEGPFLNPVRGGALPHRAMRRPRATELARLWQASRGRLKLVTVAPELPGACEAIRWCRRRGITVSLGHSDADAATAQRAVAAGATAVTHVFNGMRPLHHRRPGLLDVALTEPGLTAMAILDGVHVSPWAFRLLVRAKGVERIALVTDSIAHQGWDVVPRAGAYYTKRGTLAGSRLTLIEAVRNAIRFAGLSIAEAVRMATEVPARLLGGTHARGALQVGARADLVVFDQRVRVRLTMVGGRVVYREG